MAPPRGAHRSIGEIAREPVPGLRLADRSVNAEHEGCVGARFTLAGDRCIGHTGAIFFTAGFGALGGWPDFGAGTIGFFRGLGGGGGLNTIQNWLQETFNQQGIRGDECGSARVR